LLLAPGFHWAQQPLGESRQTAGLASVHGVVRNAASGEPLPRVLVRIEGDADAGVLTDGEGRFEMDGVPAGPQTIRLLKPGFHDRPYATEEVGFQSDGPAHSVLVAAQMPDLVFSLTPFSAIHGHVELSTGDPAQGITVNLVKQVIRNGRAVWAQARTVKTSGDGAYRFAGLPDGIYVLYTQPELESEQAVAAGAAASVARTGYPTVFYPDAHDFAAATRIHLAVGEQALANLTLTLEPFQAVSASAILPNGRLFGEKAAFGSGESNLSTPPIVVTVKDGAGLPLAYTAEYNSGTHTIQANLPDGSYALWVAAATADWAGPGQGFPASNAALKSVLATGFVEFSVEGHAVANLRVPLSIPSFWRIHLRAIRTALQPAQSTSGVSRGLQSMVTVTATRAGTEPNPEGGGDFTAEEAGQDLLDLTSGVLGPVWLSAMVNDHSLCIGSFTAGGVNLAREPLNVGLSSVPLPMELTLRDDCGKLALQLPPSLASFVPGDEPFYTVYVVPDFDSTADLPPMTIHPSSGPILNLDGLTPGSYHVYVFDSPFRLEYRNAAALAALPNAGQAVTLSPGATASLVLEVPGH
jgi:hypothetical protein